MKKSRGIIAIVFLATMLVIYMPKTVIGTGLKIAIPNTSEVLVDGVSKRFEAYTIESNNYFKLRDIAMVLNGTKAQFEVVWNEDLKAIDIFTNRSYTRAGGELRISSHISNREANKSISKIYCDGKEQQLTIYTIEGNNYFKLRDLGSLIGFEVTWENKKIGILTGQTGQGENVDVRDSFYYINETLDEKFYNDDLESYRIFKYDKGKTRRISNNRAYEFCQIGNSIYYIKMDYLGREDGSAQTGSLWKLDLDNDDETLVLEDNIYTIASDGKYIYFTRYDDLGNDNIMRMEPGKQAEIFLKDCKSYRLAYSNGWLYYVEDKSYNIMRININTKEKQKVSENRADPESELKFIIYGDMLIMPTHDTNWNSIVVKENMVTHEKKVMPNDNINYLGISKAGTLYYLDTDREEIIFTKFE